MFMSDKTEQLLKRYFEKKSASKPAVEARDDEQVFSYLKAASVLHVFNPDTLQPTEEKWKHAKPHALLLDYIILLYGDDKDPQFTLQPSTRREALKRFRSREEKIKTLECNPDRKMTHLQLLWEQYLVTGFIPDIQQLGYEELIALNQMMSWITEKDASMPGQEDVDKLIKERTVLAAFEHLVVANFTGRKQELTVLRKHIRSRTNAKSEKGIVEKVTGWFSTISSNPVLSIYGSGGIGKSALVGSLLKEVAHTKKEERGAFAYLAFDQPTLRIENPYTILIEIVSQLKLQFEDMHLAFDEFDNRVRGFRGVRGRISESKKYYETRSARIQGSLGAEENFYIDFVILLNRLNQINNAQFIVLVLDTFEEVQYRDREMLSSFWHMLTIICREVPRFRVIITGRSAIAKEGFQKDLITELRLEELNIDDRIILLTRLKVEDVQVAKAVAEQVGGNPLSLHLAANLIASDKKAATTKGIKDLNTRKWLLFQVDEYLIQGQLYERIIEHMHSEEAKKLAHPGMVLRKITPDIILQIVAPVCDIKVENLPAARKLFEELKREQALVISETEERLIYRPEIRTSMVKLLRQDKFDEVRKLHRAAIQYYSRQRSDEQSRGEELYHRLMLNEGDLYQLESLWSKNMEKYVVANLDEYPDRTKVWLASRAGIELPRKIFENAEIGDWERNVTRKVKQALQYQDISSAFSLLKERSNRSNDSPLFALEAKACILASNMSGAIIVLDKGIEQVVESSNRGRLAELFWLKAQVFVLQLDYTNAEQLLSQAEIAMDNNDDAHALMHIICHRIILRLNDTLADKQKSYELKLKLSNLILKTKHRYYEMEFVVNLSMNLLGEEFPVSRAQFEFYPLTKDIMLGMLTTENLRGLEKFRADWEEEGEDNEINQALV
jgi:hypothetical protein